MVTSALERRQNIVSIVRIRRSVRVGELSERLGVSEVTVRKDLAILEEMGFVQRTHGGVALAETADERSVLRARRSEHGAAKCDIAESGRALLSQGETVFIDSGSTCACLAPLVRDMELRVVTNSIDVLLALADAPDINLHCTGGAFRQAGGSFIGPFAEEMIDRMTFDHAFLGASGISHAGRFSSQNVIEAQVKRKVIAASQVSVVLADRYKIGREAFAVYADAETIDILVSDVDIKTQNQFEALGIHVIPVADSREDEK